MSEPLRSLIIPTLRYHDAEKAISWLCEAFGFERHLVVPGASPGEISHAQLTSPAGMIMLGSSHEDEFDRLQKPPSGPEGPVTQSAYIVVPDADAHYEKAVAAGARIAMAIVDQSYGGRGYSCFDPEGHLWNFGTYDPWTDEADE